MKEKIQSKAQMLTLLEQEFNQWEAQIANLSEEKITTASFPNGWIVKDLFAHLLAWDQLIIVRLEAVQLDRDPIMPEWTQIAATDIDEEEKLRQYNARIDDTYREYSWVQVYESWKTNFQKILTVAEEMSEADLLETGKYSWLKGYSLMGNLQGMYEHYHEEHRSHFLSWVQQ